jgi:hypothetical protein
MTMTHPAGHPEPEPIPTPEPDPPLPIPPPEPIPVPQPPHVAAPADAAEHGTALDSPEPATSDSDGTAPAWAVADARQAASVTAAADATEAVPVGAAADATPAGPLGAHEGSGDSGRETRTMPLGRHNVEAEATTPTVAVPRPAATDFIDGEPPTAPVEFPPLGAYPGEPGHPAGTPSPDPTEVVAPVHDEETAQPAHWQEPWHAQHERPGEWHTHPPDHLAWQHSPPPEFQEEPTQPVWGTPPAPPWQVELKPEPPARRRAGLWVSMALTLILLLCGGGAVSAYFLITNADTGKGAPDPATAVNRFLTAVYTQQDARAADDLVCRDARDADKLAARVSEIKDLSNQYQGPTFKWNEPAVNGQTDDRATVTVQLTLSTDDEKTAEQTLTFTTIHKTGWLVCDVAG